MTPRSVTIPLLLLVPLVTLVGATFVGAAAGPEPLSLRQAVERVVKGNVDLQREGIVLRATEANIVTALGGFDVVLAADGTLARRLVPPTNIGAVFSVAEGPSFDLSLSRNLETGGQIILSGAGAWTDILGGTSYYTGAGTLTFTHPLLRGFGREVAEANLRKARIARNQELWNRQARAANVLRDSIIAYWELAYQTADLEIRRSAVELAQQQLKTTEAQIQVGKMGELQAAAVRRAIADDQQEVEASQQRLDGRALDLLRLFGTPVPNGFLPSGLRAVDAAQAQPHEVNAGEETQRALAASPALKALRQGIALSAVDVFVAGASLRPQMDVAISVGRTARNPDLDQTIQQLFERDRTTASAGFTFSLPIQNRAARGAADAAQAAQDSTRLTAFDLELAIRDGVARLASQIHSASRRVDLAAQSVKYAQQNLEAEQARFQVGQSTNNDVLLRQQELKQTQINAARAAVDLLEADVALSAVTGDILETYGVTLKGL